MPVFRDQAVLIARNVKAFLNLEAGITRGEIPEPMEQTARQREQLIEQRLKLEQTERQLASKEAELAKLRAQLAGGEAHGIRPENIIWMFCTARSGSTWLSSMMGDISGHEVWKEPKIGQLFGMFYYVQSIEKQRRAKKFIMGAKHEGVWLKSIRSMVLDGARSRFPGLTEEEYLVVKEVDSAIGAPLMMRALPESRMIMLVRDPRDVVASALDATRQGNWFYNWRGEDGGERDGLASMDPLTLVNQLAEGYLHQMSKAREAYDAHGGPKALVRYEELRADTSGEMKRIYSALRIPVDDEEISRVVERHSWESVPQEKKGVGKFYRKASPGGWREDLTPEQAEVVESITTPLLKEFYPHEIQG